MSIKSGADCNTMAEVREGVDALDRELVALLVKRQAYMSAAGRIKNGSVRRYCRTGLAQVD